MKGHGPLPLLSTGEAASWVPCSALDSPLQERRGTTGDRPAKGHEDGEGLEGAVVIWGGAKRAGLEKRKLRVILSTFINIWWGEKRMWSRLFSVVHSEGTRGNGHILRYRKFHLKRRSLFSGDDGYGLAQPIQRIPAVCLSSEILRIKWAHFQTFCCNWPCSDLRTGQNNLFNTTVGSLMMNLVPFHDYLLMNRNKNCF